MGGSLIDIQTKDGKYKPELKGGYIKQVKLESPQRDTKIYAPNYDVEAMQRIPDYRIQLLWEPTILLDTNEYSASFFTSDVTGIYKIRLEGYTEDGKHIVHTKYFVVK